MQTEYEATFKNIDKDAVRAKLRGLGAVLIYEEFLQKRVTFNLPESLSKQTNFVRVRQEYDKITLTYKNISGEAIDGQKEIEVVVDDLEKTAELLEKIGCIKKAYQENLREKWKVGDTEIVIDEWPFLEPLVEVEGESEEAVKKVAESLGFEWKEAIFDAATLLYAEKYKVSKDKVNNHIPKIVFDMENPFLG